MKKMPVVLLLPAVLLAGCSSSSHPQAAQVQVTARQPTPSQGACASGIRAFDVIVGPLTREDPAATAQQWSSALAAVANTPGVDTAMATAIATEASDIATAGITAGEVASDPVSYPWASVMPAAEQRLDTGFLALGQACQKAGVHT
jgi:hypothetical protein